MQIKFLKSRSGFFFLFNIILVVLFVIAVLKIDWLNLGYQAARAHPIYFFFIFLLNAAALTSQGIAWRFIMGAQGLPLPILKSIEGFFSGNYMGKVTPGHVGDFMRAAYVVDGFQTGTGYALSGIMMEKVLKDIMLVLATFSLLLVYTSGYRLMTPLKASALTLGMTAMLVSVAAIYFHPRVRGWAIWLCTRNGFMRQYRELLQSGSDGIDKGYSVVSKKRLIAPAIFLLISFFFQSWQGYAINQAVGIGLPFITITRFVLVSLVASRLAPVTFMGMGARELALLALFEDANVPLALASGYIAIDVFMQNVVFPFLGLMLWTTRQPQVLKEESKDLSSKPAA